MERATTITLDIAEFNSLLKEANQPSIYCMGNGCKFHNPALASGCTHQAIYLRKGTCRHFEQGKLKDRTDLGKGNYFTAIGPLAGDPDNTSRGRHDK